MENYENESVRLFKEGKNMEHLKHVSKHLLSNPSVFVNIVKGNLAIKAENTLNMKIKTKNGIIKLSEDENFQKILADLRKFADYYSEEYLQTKQKEVKSIKVSVYFEPDRLKEVYGFLRTYFTEVESTSNILKILQNAQTKGITHEKIKEETSFYQLIYEKTADLLEGFAIFINKKELILTDKKDKPFSTLTKGNIFRILSNFQSKKFKDLFSIFNPVLRNAIAHKDVEILFDKNTIIFKDKKKQLELTLDEYALQIILSVFFTNAMHIVIGEKFSELAETEFLPLFELVNKEDKKPEELFKKALQMKGVKL